jgi:hypothetical protein
VISCLVFLISFVVLDEDGGISWGGAGLSGSKEGEDDMKVGFRRGRGGVDLRELEGSLLSGFLGFGESVVFIGRREIEGVE